jgi:hypothetical protein
MDKQKKDNNLIKALNDAVGCLDFRKAHVIRMKLVEIECKRIAAK